MRQTIAGLTLLPPLPGDKYRYEEVEELKVETPANIVFECDAKFSVPFITPAKLIYIITVPSVKETDIPLGSKIWLLNKTEEQIAIPPFTNEAKEKAINEITELVKDFPADLKGEIIKHVTEMKTDETKS